MSAAKGQGHPHPLKGRSVKYSDELKKELKKLWASGMKTADISRKLKISKNAVIGLAHRIGVKNRPSPLKNPPTVQVKPPSPGVKSCEWIEGDPGTAKCGKPLFRGSYCKKHADRAYAKPTSASKPQPREYTPGEGRRGSVIWPLK